MNSNQVPLVGENVTQADIYISVIITALMTDSCDPILSLGGHFEVTEVAFLTQRVHPLPTIPHQGRAIVFISFWKRGDSRCRMAKRHRLPAVLQWLIRDCL